MRATTANTKPEITGGPWPLARWTMLVAWAVLGSCLYAASLTLAALDYPLIRTLIWFTCSAGFAWLAFIRCMSIAGRLPLNRCIDIALQTMAVGELVLCAGALVNLTRHLIGQSWAALPLNCVIVLLSNIAMAWFCARQFQACGVPARRTICIWMLALNVPGALLFTAIGLLLFLS
jgi:hypothetical protein